MVDDLDKIFTQEELWEGNGWSLVTAGNRSVTSTDLPRLPKTVPALRSDFANLVAGLGEELQAKWAATVKAERDTER